MAKSKKALKALRRRHASKGRSRALKQRQDYTLGGRVKAFAGFNPDGSLDAETQAAIQAAQNADAAKVKAANPASAPLVATDSQAATNTYEEQISNLMENQGKTREEAVAQNTSAITQGGDLNADGFVTNEEWREFKTPAVVEEVTDTNWGTLEQMDNAQWLVNMGLQPDLDSAKTAVLATAASTPAPTEEPSTGEAEDTTDQAVTDAVEPVEETTEEIYEKQLSTLMEMQGMTREEAIAHNADAVTQGADLNRDGTVTNEEWTAFKGRNPSRFDSTSEDTSRGDPADKVLSDVYSEAKRDQYKLDRPEAFATIETPDESETALTDRVLEAPTDVDEKTTSSTDASVAAGEAGESSAQAELSPPAMEAYNQAEANYFNKYPEARNAILEGNYSNIFNYHAQEGKNKGYSLEFDTSKIAESDFNTLAASSRADLTDTTAATRSASQEEAALTEQPAFAEDLRSQVDPVTGDTFQLAATPAAEKQQRLAITDETAATGTEAIIQGSIGYEAAERRALKGEAASGAARSLLQEVGELPTDITEVIVDNPTQIIAQIDTQPVEVQAAIAALPPEALMSAQLETLLAGIDEGTTPTWARPAVQLVESRLNARGLSVSTVGRDALFNAIIQTALPIAQNNAAALQQRANQNLSNEQQANLQQSSQEMQLRLTNVANRQTAETQSAQLAQQLKLTQGEIKQQTALTESQERQQVRLQSLQNEQQAEMANLGNDQQIELANLQVEAERLGANQTAKNQEKIAEMQVAAGFMQKNGEFVQQMELANLSNDQQMRLSFLTAKNQAESENLTANQQTELANLNKRLEVNKLNASLAQQMGLAQLNVDQQRAVQNASTVANIDLTKFSAEQQIELTNSKFMQTATLQDLNNRQQTIMQDATALASMDLQAADSLTKVSIENARNFLQKDLTELNAEQQSFMLDAQQSQQRMLTASASENASKQFNATSQGQTDQFMASLGQQLNLQNTAQANAMAQFNASEANRLAAVNSGNTLDAAKFSNQMNTQIEQFNTQIDFQRDQWNKQNAQAVEQSNVNWRRQTNMAETAAQNAANQLQAQQLFTLDQQEQAFLWQQLRDEATYYRTQYESEEQRKTTLYATALANESKYAVNNVSTTFSKISSLFKDLASPNAEQPDNFNFRG